MSGKAWILAALIALAGCGNQNGAGGGTGAAAVQPDQVDPQVLRAAVSDERVERFYEARNWRPAWTAGDARVLVEAIGEAERHALDPGRFLAEAEQADTPSAREAALSLAALSYAEALARGRTDPRRIRDVYTVARPNPELAAGLNQALQNGQVGQWLASLAPQDDEYRALSEAYLRYSRRAGREQRSPIGAGDVIRPGGSDPRIPPIVERLRAEGYLAAPAREPQAEQGKQDKQAKQTERPNPNRYTPEMAAAVRRLQQEYGLEANGTIGPDTLTALNAGSFDRARTLAVNLERRRWLERTPPATRIDVNTAAATLSYWRGNTLADRRRVVVGQPGNETPQLGSPIFRLVANPSWTVPKSIEEEEIAPKGEGYMRRNNMIRRDGMIVQLPGPTNALGQVKFDMQNDHAIYLHDTPAKALFAEEQRHFSHGCVRVHDALGFARLIAGQEGVIEEFERGLATGEETFVPLPRRIPVRLLYQTAFVEDGRVMFRADPYGWDDDVARALGLAAHERRASPTHRSDVGP